MSRLTGDVYAFDGISLSINGIMIGSLCVVSDLFRGFGRPWAFSQRFIPMARLLGQLRPGLREVLGTQCLTSACGVKDRFAVQILTSCPRMSLFQDTSG